MKSLPMGICEAAYKQIISLALIQQVPESVFNFKDGNRPLRTPFSFQHHIETQFENVYV